MLRGPADFIRQRGGDAFIGIDLEHPGAFSGVDTRVPARPFALPGALDDMRSEAACDFLRSVGAAVEHDNQLVDEIERLQAIGELGLLVMRDDNRREQRTIAAHAALLARDHKARAAASAASTDSESISVSVVR